MNVFLGILITFCFMAPQKTFAYTPKEGNVTATFGPFFHKTNFDSTSTGAESPVYGGYGLIANGDANDREGLEIGLFYMPKIYMQEQSGKYVTEQTDLLHITMGYKRWLSECVSFSLAFFSSYTIGDPKIVHNDFVAGTEPNTSAQDTTEYGFDVAVQTELWHQNRLALILDTRYSFSVTNKRGEAGDHYGALLGIRYFIQGKEEEQKRTNASIR